MAFLAYKVVYPLLDSIIMGAVLAYIFYPIYSWLNSRINRPTCSAFIICLVVVALSLIPLIVLGRALLHEATTIYITTRETLTDPSLFSECPESEGLVCGLKQFAGQAVSDPNVRDAINEAARSIGHLVTEKVASALYAIPQLIIFTFVAFFVMFFLFIDGPKVLARIRKNLPVKASCQDLIIARISTLTRAVVFGSVLIAIIQGIFGAIGFLVLGVPQPLLWGAIMTIFALIPYVGTAIIWGPAALILVATGATIKGIILAIYGTCVISTVDNLLKPLVIGKTAKLHSLLVFLGVLGGITLMGPIGFIVGPVILAVFEALLESYELEKGEIL